MVPSSEPPSEPTIAVLGGTGRFGRPYIEAFLDEGLNIRILARRSKKIAGRFTRTQVMQGSMMALGDVIEPHAHTLQDVTDIYQEITGRPLVSLGRWTLPLVKILGPLLFRWCYPKGASRVGLFDFFNSNDWVGDSRQLTAISPGFQTTAMGAYLTSRFFHGP